MKHPTHIIFVFLVGALCLIASGLLFFQKENREVSKGTSSVDKQSIEKPSKDIRSEDYFPENNILAATDNTSACPKSSGGLAGDTGLKVWCWADIDLPDYSGKKGADFSDGELHIDSECYEKQVSKEDNRLRFQVDPVQPNAGDWCSNDYNMRAEIRTVPWNIRHEPGTEEWFGWSYTFGDDYSIDVNNEWMMFQVYPGPAGLNPQISLQILSGHQFETIKAGTLCVVNSCDPQNGSASDYVSTGIIPVAGRKLDIVVHVIWGDASEGLLQVWIDDKVVFNKEAPTVLSSHPWGGNAKWGIYKFPWREDKRVQQSIDQGITRLQTSMGPLRIITRRPEDPNYGENSYSEVRPR